MSGTRNLTPRAPPRPIVTNPRPTRFKSSQVSLIQSAAIERSVGCLFSPRPQTENLMRANAGQMGPSHRGGEEHGGNREGAPPTPPPPPASESQITKETNYNQTRLKKRGVAYLWGRPRDLILERRCTQH